MTLETQDERQTYQTVASRIVQLIAEAGLKPGDRLPTERELGRELGVSRHTVSQAVKVLAVSGMLRPRQGSGIYVMRTTPPTASGFIDVTVRGDPRQVQQLCEFRMTLEMQTARLAAERITPRGLRQIEEAAQATFTSAEQQDPNRFTEADTAFHAGIAEATGNEYLLSAVATVISLQFWAGDTAMGEEGGKPGSPIASAQQHLAIARAIHDGDADAAALGMQQHIQTFFESYELEVRRRMIGDLSTRS
ncbi:MAG: FadR family transcriptional regulator [Ktedonobacterales bacterium]|nr:FadR family transcriptional regulator [Ktedonobacterales bacterium]